MNRLISICFRCNHCWEIDFEPETCTCTEEHFDYDIFEVDDDEADNCV